MEKENKKQTIVNGDLELVTVPKKNGERHVKNKTLIAIQEKSVNDLIATINAVERVPNNALVLESYAKTLTTLKNKIDKQRVAIKKTLNKEGEEVHKFYQTKFIKPLESAISKIEKDVKTLTQPIEVEAVEVLEVVEAEVETSNINTTPELPTHIIKIQCEVAKLTKLLSYLQQLGIVYSVD